MIPDRKGFVDLQVNGFLGVDFSSPTLTFEDVQRATRALVDAGTIAYCPTLITADVDVYRRNFPLLARALEDPFVGQHALGLHLEGPFLSPLEGARGAHLADKMRLPNIDDFRRFQDWAGGKIAILTLAPELPGAIDLIQHIRENYRTKVALGHHVAPRDILRQAAAAGATLITHLGNGCPNSVPRHESVLIHQLANDDLVAGLITDGHHLPQDFIRVAFRCKTPERIFVVSDAAPIAGLPPGIYQTLGNQVRLSAQGRIENVHAPHLVGSGCHMAQCMRHLRSLGFLTDEDLWKVGCENPLRILGRSVDPSVLANLPEFVF